MKFHRNGIPGAAACGWCGWPRGVRHGTAIVLSALLGGVVAGSLACGSGQVEGPGPELIADPAPSDGGAGNGLGTSELDRGVAYVKLGAFDKAIAHFDKALEADPSNAQAAYYRALAYDQTGHRREAEAGYRHAIELDGKLVEARINLGAMYLEEPIQPDKAVAVLEPAVELAPQAGDARENLAYAYRLTKQLDKASEQYRKALEIADSARVQFAFADMLFEAGQREASVEHMRAALPGYRDDLKHLIMLAHRFAKAKAYQDCVAGFDAAIKLKADEPGFFLHRGLCKHSLKDEPGARADFEQALKIDDKFAPAYYYLGMSQLLNKQRAKAAKAFQRAKKLGKGTPVGDKANKQLQKMKGRR